MLEVPLLECFNYNIKVLHFVALSPQRPCKLGIFTLAKQRLEPRWILDQIFGFVGEALEDSLGFDGVVGCIVSELVLSFAEVVGLVLQELVHYC